MPRSDDRKGRFPAVLLALAFFALGLLAARFFGVMSPAAAPSNRDAPPAASSARALFPPEDAGAPRIFFDPASISLLPDASLQIEMPTPPDAGSSLH